MLSRETPNEGPSIRLPIWSASKVGVIASDPLSHRTNGLAAAGADDFAVLVDELVEGARLQRDGVVGPRRHVVIPALPGIDGAGATHPVVGRRTSEHQQD